MPLAEGDNKNLNAYYTLALPPTLRVIHLRLESTGIKKLSKAKIL